ncbi:MAG: NAD(P)-dependent oxidoreductase [Chloroflexota bacterium]
MPKRVGQVGLGNIGLPMAKEILKAGYEMIGYRRTQQDEFVAAGGVMSASAKGVAEKSDIVITCLPSDEALLEVVTGADGLVQGAHKGLVVIETGLQQVSTKLKCRDALQAVGVQMLDCPISGTPPMVPARKTSLFCSGDKATYEASLPILQAICDKTPYLGEFGAGTKMKCVANLLVAVNTVATAEALVLADKAGLNLQDVLDTLGPSIAGSMMMQVRGPWMAARDWTPKGAVRQVIEFVPAIRGLVADIDGTTPLFDESVTWYEKAVEQGRADQDIAILFAVLNEEN